MQDTDLDGVVGLGGFDAGPDGKKNGCGGIEPAMSSGSHKISCWLAWVDQSILTHSVASRSVPVTLARGARRNESQGWKKQWLHRLTSPWARNICDCSAVGRQRPA